MSRDTEPLAGNDRHTRWSGPSGSRRRPARGSAVRQVPRHECPAPLSSPDPPGLSPCVWGPQETTGPRVVQNQARSRASLSLRPSLLSSPTCSQKGDARRGLSRPGSLAVRMALAPPLTATPAQPPLCPRLAQHTQVPTSPAESTPRTSVPPRPAPRAREQVGPSRGLAGGDTGQRQVVAVCSATRPVWPLPRERPRSATPTPAHGTAASPSEAGARGSFARAHAGPPSLGPGTASAPGAPCAPLWGRGPWSGRDEGLRPPVSLSAVTAPWPVGEATRSPRRPAAA